jgi:amidophosphoribosyltransferase
MSDSIKHECGIAVIRLLKPLDYYQNKYGNALYGLNKLYLLMEKQHNRGQDGAGVATIKLNPVPGFKYIDRMRSNSAQPIKEIFQKIYEPLRTIEEKDPAKLKDGQWLKNNVEFSGELMLGHLRYGTHGKNSIDACHPFIRGNNWMTRNLVLAGNFNMTNVDELIEQLIEIGQHPKEQADTVTVLEKIGHFLDVEVQRQFDIFKKKGFGNRDISRLIGENIDVQRILARSVKDFDGGYAMAGLIGHGDAFVVRDPSGIRPAFYYCDDEVCVAASERPAIMTAFNVRVEQVKELHPGKALIIRKNGEVKELKIAEPAEKKSCSFERIYFSRGTDKDIYQERKKLGHLLTDKILNAIDYDLHNTVFSFIPNTAEVAFYGLMDGLNDYLNKHKIAEIKKLGSNPGDAAIEKVLSFKPRVEKLAIKDVKMRTFITEDATRDELVSHVYDVTYGLINNNVDTIVVIDDSIVRGTTLQQSILNILDRLAPKRIIVVSSAPQIRYPDCYGIDMSKLKDFVAFRAMIALLKEHNKEYLLQEVYTACKKSLEVPLQETKNEVKVLYDQFTDDEISSKISEILRPKHIFSNVDILYQSIENLHLACPNHLGDWYFSGNFPTKGGNRVVNKAFINYIEGKDTRAY